MYIKNRIFLYIALTFDTQDTSLSTKAVEKDYYLTPIIIHQEWKSICFMSLSLTVLCVVQITVAKRWHVVVFLSRSLEFLTRYKDLVSRGNDILICWNDLVILRERVSYVDGTNY